MEDPTESLTSFSESLFATSNQQQQLGFMELLGISGSLQEEYYFSSPFDSMLPSSTTRGFTPSMTTSSSPAAEVLNNGPATPNSSSVSSVSSGGNGGGGAPNDHEQTTTYCDKSVGLGDDEEEQHDKTKKLEPSLMQNKGLLLCVNIRFAGSEEMIVDFWGLCRLKPKKTCEKKKKEREPKFAFMTKSEVDHLEDGYRWRKYGQKAVKNSPFPRSYYRCTSASCNVKKRVERSFTDHSIVVTTYEGQHTHHSPLMMPRPSPLTSRYSQGGSGRIPAGGFSHQLRTLTLPSDQQQQFNNFAPLNCGGYNSIVHTAANEPSLRGSQFSSRSPASSASIRGGDYGLLQDMVPSTMNIIKDES
ncbi:hypothetical protein RJ639_033595 [Escallonia herrerae]|uniref:WRKY domain-containing protein n=1 Tax=Escallonia herrerae TaxID=1293975 RepID=A0AA88X9K9_9ASTE|nr:hypothetical protein RJ639_033595 [Escallonia herrerae]